tara:strand:+ start:67 stop:672 length:606 start_codon:yes stop_codon:yes gene_type:complete
MTNDINFYSRAYDNFLEPSVCDEYINLYEQTLKEEADRVKELDLCYEKDGTKICNQCTCMRVNIMRHDRFKELNKMVLKKLMSAVKRYKQDVNLHSVQWPKKYGWEEFKIKRYVIGKAEEFKHHVDVTSHSTAKRFLVLMIYLNDNFSEGETIFPVFGDTIKPKKGRLFMFPPLWPYLHAGKLPKGPGFAKYFLGTYLTYE